MARTLDDHEQAAVTEFIRHLKNEHVLGSLPNVNDFWGLAEDLALGKGWLVDYAVAEHTIYETIRAARIGGGVNAATLMIEAYNELLCKGHFSIFRTGPTRTDEEERRLARQWRGY